MHCFFLFMFTKMVESVWRLTSKLSEMGQEKKQRSVQIDEFDDTG